MSSHDRYHSGRHCARCDALVPDGVDACQALTLGPTGRRISATVCGCRAFYIGRPPQRHIMARQPDEPESAAEAPMHARTTHHGRRHGAL